MTQYAVCEKCIVPYLLSRSSSPPLRLSRILRDYAMTMGKKVIALAGELMPGDDRAYNHLRDLTREVCMMYVGLGR